MRLMQALNGVKYEIRAQGRTGMGRLVGCSKQKGTRSTRRSPAVPVVSSGSRTRPQQGGRQRPLPAALGSPAERVVGPYRGRAAGRCRISPLWFLQGENQSLPFLRRARQ